ncbi:hypothetical protein B0H63DRAFT_544726 [Podospora didyma]|uniref:DUF6606 domain-containing protein n=1 Tax=Podospora didyma TaxID=330526 RepID=A0AAE0NR30_9PEZI|nr:hypothetical protein B0H63DRAFT_544726 [Podospora didyma]
MAATFYIIMPAALCNWTKHKLPTDTVLLHVRAQNAGMLLTRKHDVMLVEAFQLLAGSGTVMACADRLDRKFPDRAAIVPLKAFLDPDFFAEFTRILLASLVCLSTFDIDQGYLVVIMYEAREMISTKVRLGKNTGLAEGIARFWPDFKTFPSSHVAPWTIESESSKHILQIESYQETAAFQRLFGSEVFDVVPATVSHMTFSTRQPKAGWILHFGTQLLAKSGKVVIQATQQRTGETDGERDTWEYLPTVLFQGFIPAEFVDDYAQWYNLRTGEIEFRPIDQLLTTSRKGLGSFPCDIWVTADYASTVQPPHNVDTVKEFCMDMYQRPVQCVLTSALPNEPMQLVVISPAEASELKPLLLANASTENKGVVPEAHLHLYKPRQSHSLPPLDDLRSYMIPSPLPQGWDAPQDLIMQLNLFAGQLYFASYEEYVRLCRFLGLTYQPNQSSHDEDGGVDMEEEGEQTASATAAQGAQMVIDTDGFGGKKLYLECRFHISPVPFLKEVLQVVRRYGGGIGKTHVGRMLSGEILGPGEFKMLGRASQFIWKKGFDLLIYKLRGA